MNFNFGEVLTKAWKITWKYKVLWIFGMLASCGQGSNNSSNIRNSYDSGQNQMNPEMSRQLEEFVQQVTSWVTNNMWFIYLMVVILLLLILVQIFLGTTGLIGLIRGAHQADGEAETLQFGTLFRESLHYFWRMFGMGLVVWLPFFIVFIGSLFVFLFSAIGFGRMDMDAFGGAMALFFVGFCCCLIPIAIVLGVYYAQAERALVIEDLGIFASIQRGWQVFKSNLAPLAGIWFILLILGILAGILISLPYLIVVLPLMINFITGKTESWQPFINAGIVVLCYYPIFWLLSGLLRTYTETSWTLTYLRLTRKPEETIVPAEANA